MKVDILKDGVKVDSLDGVTVERKPYWTVVRPTDPYSLNFRVYAHGTFEVKEV